MDTPPTRSRQEPLPVPSSLGGGPAGLLGRCLGVGAVALLVLPGTARAIPSPDVLVNMFASAAQVLGLATVVLGRWFVVSGRRKLARGPAAGSGYRTAFLAAAGLFLATLVGWGLSSSYESDLRSRRLQVNIDRNSREDGKLIADVSLKELSFSDQQKREDGIQTGDLAALLERGEKPQMVDIRETEEYEVGGIAGVKPVRFPDLMARPGNHIRKGEPVYLFCANGNRSSELAGFLEDRGYDCRFLVGGYEKWLSEDRPVEMRGNRKRKELRELPDFAGKDVLLDTPDVVALLEERKEVLFLDVRYPGEFEKNGHLPGAINLPIRKLTTPELEEALRALPRQPVIVPCYDRRSSFFALIAGVRLTRMGYEFLGRYTVPHEFWIPGKDKAHVEAWKQRQEQATLLSAAAAPFDRPFGWMRENSGGLALAILLSVLLIRLLVLPLTLRSDRDRIVQRRLAPRIRGIKARLAGDGPAIARATEDLLQEHRVRPVVNLAATLAQVVLFMVFFKVVDQASRGSTESFLWLTTLGTPDSTQILPVAVGALLVAQMWLSAARVTWMKVVLWAACAVGLFLLVTGLNAGTNLYLAANLLGLVVQTAIAEHVARRREATSRVEQAARWYGRNVVPLRFAHIVPGCGGKAARLGELMAAGLPVPDGFVVRGPAVEAHRRRGVWDDADRRLIRRAHRRLGAERVAVRSSGLNEDGQSRSYAGVFDSLLEVGPDRLFEALCRVADSMASARVKAYSGVDAESGSIVVQGMVAAEYAGVLFTEHPSESGACAVEMVAGLGDDLVSGRVDPLSFRFGRASGAPLDGKHPPIDVVPLVELGRRLEDLFGRPQDIEWAYAEGRFHLLQSRDITRLVATGTDARAVRERERGRLLRRFRGRGREEIVLEQNELSELLPEPSRFSLGLMQEMWSYGGSTYLACSSLGIPYEVLPDSDPYVLGAFGALYVNPAEGRRRAGRGPSALAAFRLSRAAGEIERAWREDFLPANQRETRLLEAVDLGSLATAELVDLFRERTKSFLTQSYVQAETINVAADFYFKAAVRQLEKRSLDPAAHLSHLPRTVVQEAMDLLADAGLGKGDLSGFMRLFGHRAPQDYEISQPRYREQPAVAMAMASRAGRVKAMARPEAPITSAVARLAVERACRFQALKEEAKHHAMRELAFLRSLMLAIGERTGLGEGIFQLEPAEVRRLDEPGFRDVEAPALCRERREAAEILREIRLPGEVTVALLEGLELETAVVLVPVAAPAAGGLAGRRVSGTGGVRGRVRALHRPEEISSFVRGEVLVARYTDPTWMPVFPLAGGIVTEVGGWLSHAAIQAREHELTGIVGVTSALQRLKTGDLVHLLADGSIEVFDERRIDDRTSVLLEVEIDRNGTCLQARIQDVSLSGALVVVTGQALGIGEDIGLRCATADVELEATVIRNGIPGVYGVRFGQTLGARSAARLGIDGPVASQGVA